MTSEVPMGDLVAHAIGGGWGSEAATDDSSEVVVIRGADFPNYRADPSSVPRRFEKSSRVPQRTLQHGDIVLEISGGTKNRSTGRTIFISQEDLDRFGSTAIPASFCRLLRVNGDKVDSRYVYYWLQEMHASGRAWRYQNQSTGLSNFQFKYFLETEFVRVPPMVEQRATAEILAALDARIELHAAQHRVNVRLFQGLVDRAVASSPTSSGQFELTIGGDWGEDEPSGKASVAVYCLRGKDIENYLAGSVDDIPLRYVSPASVEKRSIRPGDVLTAGSGTLGPSLLVTESMVSDFDRPVIYSNFVKRLRPSSANSSGTTLVAALWDLWESGEIQSYKTGTAMPNLDGKGLARRLAVAQPDHQSARKAMASAELLLSPVHIRAANNLREIRDNLRPNLLSGELRIGSPERLLEGVP